MFSVRICLWSEFGIRFELSNHPTQESTLAPYRKAHLYFQLFLCGASASFIFLIIYCNISNEGAGLEAKMRCHDILQDLMYFICKYGLHEFLNHQHYQPRQSIVLRTSLKSQKKWSNLPQDKQKTKKNTVPDPELCHQLCKSRKKLSKKFLQSPRMSIHCMKFPEIAKKACLRKVINSCLFKFEGP